MISNLIRWTVATFQLPYQALQPGNSHSLCLWLSFLICTMRLIASPNKGVMRAGCVHTGQTRQAVSGIYRHSIIVTWDYFEMITLSCVLPSACNTLLHLCLTNPLHLSCLSPQITAFVKSPSVAMECWELKWQNQNVWL